MVIYSQQNTQLIRKTAVNCFNADWRTTTVLWFSQTKQENKLTKGSKQACCLHYWKHWRVYQWRSEKVNLRDRDLVQSTRPERETLTKRQRPKFERLRPGLQIRKLSRIVKKFQKCIKNHPHPGVYRREGKRSTMPGRRIIGGRRKVTKMLQLASTFFNTVHLLPKDIKFEYGGAKLVSCPRCHLTFVQPCPVSTPRKLQFRWSSFSFFHLTLLFLHQRSTNIKQVELLEFVAIKLMRQWMSQDEAFEICIFQGWKSVLNGGK